MYKEVPKNYIFPPPEEPLRPMRPVRPINDYNRERVIRPRRYIPTERLSRGGMRGASRGPWSPRDSWREYGMRGRNLRDEVGLRRGRGNMRGDWGFRGRDIREEEWRRISYGEFGRRERRTRDDFGYRGRGMRGMRNERIRGGRGARGIPRGPRGYSPRSREGRNDEI